MTRRKREQENQEAALQHDEAILVLHVSCGQMKRLFTINVRTRKTKRQRFLYSYPVIETRTRIRGQLMSPNFNGIVIHYGQNQDTLCIYGEHLRRRVTDRATGKKTLHKSKH